MSEKEGSSAPQARVDALRKGARLLQADEPGNLRETVKKLDNLPNIPEPPIDQPIRVKPKKE